MLWRRKKASQSRWHPHWNVRFAAKIINWIYSYFAEPVVESITIREKFLMSIRAGFQLTHSNLNTNIKLAVLNRQKQRDHHEGFHINHDLCGRSWDRKANIGAKEIKENFHKSFQLTSDNNDVVDVVVFPPQILSKVYFVYFWRNVFVSFVAQV